MWFNPAVTEFSGEVFADLEGKVSEYIMNHSLLPLELYCSTVSITEDANNGRVCFKNKSKPFLMNHVFFA